MKQFGFNDVEEVKGRIQPSIEKVEITGVMWKTNDNQKDYVGVSMVSLDGTAEHEERFFFSTPKGEQISLQRLKSLIKALLGEDKSKETFDIDQLNAQLTGKKARVKFVGEEYDAGEGVRLRTQLAFSSFVESLDISDEDSKLKFNPDRDIKKLAIAPSKKKEKKEVDDLFE